eukprot:SAG11_NODE_7087_length_1196_cov_1.026436_2_plen_312_part_00
MLFDSNVCLRTTASPHNTHYGQNLTYRNNIFWGGGWSSKVADPQLIAGCLRTSPQNGLPDRLRFDANLLGQVDNKQRLAQLFEGNFNASSQPHDDELRFTFASNLYWSDLIHGLSGDLATAAVFGGESSRVLGKRNGSWIPPRKFTWGQWQAQGQDTGSVLLPRGQHLFANDDWATTLNVTLRPGLATKIGFQAIDTSTAGVRLLPGAGAADLAAPLRDSCIEHNNTGASNGGDIAHSTAPTAQACGRLCQARAECCLAFYDSRDDMCFLKKQGHLDKVGVLPLGTAFTCGRCSAPSPPPPGPRSPPPPPS